MGRTRVMDWAIAATFLLGSLRASCCRASPVAFSKNFLGIHHGRGSGLGGEAGAGSAGALGAPRGPAVLVGIFYTLFKGVAQIQHFKNNDIGQKADSCVTYGPFCDGFLCRPALHWVQEARSQPPSARPQGEKLDKKINRLSGDPHRGARSGTILAWNRAKQRLIQRGPQREGAEMAGSGRILSCRVGAGAGRCSRLSAMLPSYSVGPCLYNPVPQEDHAPAPTTAGRNG
jgi:hypothetical protein